MPNNIKFVAERKSKFLTTKEYHGYGQILKISDDGVDKHIIVKPIDPVFGVTIKFLESDNPCFAVPDISIDDTAIILKNLEEAREFYAEFCKRRDEFIQDTAFWYPFFNFLAYKINLHIILVKQNVCQYPGFCIRPHSDKQNAKTQSLLMQALRYFLIFQYI